MILMILLGALVGWIASLIMKRDAEQGALANILVGIAGAFIGGVISSILIGGNRSALTLDLTGLFWATIGAVVLCAIINLITKGEAR